MSVFALRSLVGRAFRKLTTERTRIKVEVSGHGSSSRFSCELIPVYEAYSIENICSSMRVTWAT